MKKTLVIFLGIYLSLILFLCAGAQAGADFYEATTLPSEEIVASFAIDGRYEGSATKIGDGGGKYPAAVELSSGNFFVTVKIFLAIEGELPSTPQYEGKGVFQENIGMFTGKDDLGENKYYFLVLEGKMLILSQRIFADPERQGYITIGILDKVISE